VAWARGNDEGANLQKGKGVRFNSVVTNHGDICAKEGQVLIEVPSERVKVIDHKHVQRTGKMFWKGHGVNGRSKGNQSKQLRVNRVTQHPMAKSHITLARHLTAPHQDASMAYYHSVYLFQIKSY
jgi:hypothetical protein